MFGMILLRLGSLDEKIVSLDDKVIKNAIDLETIKSDLKIVFEVQKSHMDQNERDHEKIIPLIDKELSLYSMVLKNVSTDVRRIEEDQVILEKEVLTMKQKFS